MITRTSRSWSCRRQPNSISFRTANLFRQTAQTAEQALQGIVPEAERGRITEILNVELRMSNLLAAQVFVVTPTNKVLVQRRANQSVEFKDVGTIDFRYNDIINEASKSGTRRESKFIPHAGRPE